MSSPPANTWQDRRGMFQRGKEVHEPARKMSGSSSAGVMDAVRRASIGSNSDKSLVSNPLSNDPQSPSSPNTASARRRSSAASGGLFGNLTQHKRGSEDYAERRASQTEALGSGGAVAGWFNKTFRGIQASGGPGAAGQTAEQKRGVME